MIYDIKLLDGLPVCQRPNGPEACDGCYGLGDDNGTPLCMAYVRDAVAVVDPARALATRIDEIGAHPSYLEQVTLALTHGHRYDGPTWADELALLKAALGE